eukprot:COSAG02_NODE_1469_length_12459_cov_25.847896_5_plen_178_part_00
MCVYPGSCVNAQNQPVADPSACTTGGCGTPLTVGPVGQQSCSECVRAGKYFATGSCEASFIELEVDGAICSATHGVAQGLACCDSLAGGEGDLSHPAGTSTNAGGSGGLHSIELTGTVSIGGCDLTMLSMKCADTDPQSGSFCSSLCRQMAMSMADDCTREGIDLAADALASNPCLR